MEMRAKASESVSRIFIGSGTPMTSADTNPRVRNQCGGAPGAGKGKAVSTVIGRLARMTSARANEVRAVHQTAAR